MQYVYRKKKPKFRYHIATATGTVCRMERSTAFRKLDTKSDAPPVGRGLCRICAEQAGVPWVPPPPRPVQPPPSNKADSLLASFGISSFPQDADHVQLTVNLALDKLKEKYGIEYRGRQLAYGDARHILKRYLSGSNPKLHVLKHAKVIAPVPKPAKVKPVKPKPQKKAAKHPALSQERIRFIISDDFLSSWEWRKLRYQALLRGDGRCEVCGRGKVHGAVLNVDHIQPRRKYPELALVLENLQITCGCCNAGKGNWDETNWREKNRIESDKLREADRSIPWERLEAF